MIRGVLMFLELMFQLVILFIYLVIITSFGVQGDLKEKVGKTLFLILCAFIIIYSFGDNFNGEANRLKEERESLNTEINALNNELDTVAKVSGNDIIYESGESLSISEREERIGSNKNKIDVINETLNYNHQEYIKPYLDKFVNNMQVVGLISVGLHLFTNSKMSRLRLKKKKRVTEAKRMNQY